MIFTIRDLQKNTHAVLQIAKREDEAVKIKTDGEYVAIINKETIDKIKKVIKIKGLEWFTMWS